MHAGVQKGGAGAELSAADHWGIWPESMQAPGAHQLTFTIVRAPASAMYATLFRLSCGGAAGAAGAPARLRQHSACRDTWVSVAGLAAEQGGARPARRRMQQAVPAPE